MKENNINNNNPEAATTPVATPPSPVATPPPPPPPPPLVAASSPPPVAAPIAEAPSPSHASLETVVKRKRGRPPKPVDPNKPPPPKRPRGRPPKNKQVAEQAQAQSQVTVPETGTQFRAKRIPYIPGVAAMSNIYAAIQILEPYNEYMDVLKQLNILLEEIHKNTSV